MAETQGLPARDGRLVRWGGAAVVALSIGFIGQRLWTLDPAQLAGQASWPLAGAMLAATALFAGANRLLAEGWRALADPVGRLCPRAAGRIYGRGVLLKYLPGSVFQYVSRQIDARGAGLTQGEAAKASLAEIGLHLASSMTVAAGCFVAAQIGAVPAFAGVAAVGLAALLLRLPMGRAFACQLGAFSCFAEAAMLVAAAILPGGLALSQFAALFMLAWLAGYVVPVAPGGLGVREAALLALAAGSAPAAPLLAAVLTLRIASILGDLGYGLGALALARRG
jgi:hypothetical protein